MIVGPLKSSTQISIIILLVVCMGLWINMLVFYNPEYISLNYNENVLYHYFFDTTQSVWLKQIILLLVILIGATLVNFIAIDQEITTKSNFLPAFFYLLFSFSAATKHKVEPILVANLLVLPALYFLIASYRQEKVLSQFFKPGLCMGLASFFCIDYMIVFPLMYIALVILRPFNWREWAILTIGLITPLYIYMCFCYLSNNDILNIFYMMERATSQLQKPIISEYYIGFLFMSALLVVFALFNYLNKGFGAKIKTQKAKYILFWMLGLCLLMVFFEQISDMILLSSIIPLSIIVGDYLAEIKQLKIANTLLMLFVGGFAVIYFHALGII